MERARTHRHTSRITDGGEHGASARRDTGRAIRTPRAAAVAGIVFSILFATSAVLTAWAIPPGSEDAGTRVHDEAKRNAVSLSLQLLPFAGAGFVPWLGLIFPAWVFVLSAHILVAAFRSAPAATEDRG